MDVVPSGPFYTWFNGSAGTTHVDSHLDKILVSSEFTSSCASFSGTVLTCHRSDHQPVLFAFSFALNRVSRFSFESIWSTHPSLWQVIENH